MTTPQFDSNFFQNNRERLKRLLKIDIPIVVTANGMIQRGADSSYPFSQDSNFWYLTGINDPDITLVIDGDREFLIVPIREGVRVTFDGQIDVESLSRASGITDIVNEATGWKRLDGILEKVRKVASMAPAPPYIEQYGMYANPARARLVERIERHVSDIELTDIREALANLRMIKQEPELKAIQAAIDVTAATLSDVLSMPLGSYKYEFQIEADISRGFRFRGSSGHSFEPIVAGGARACTLHNISNSAPLRDGELVVIDVGAEVKGYAADITRVFANGKPSSRQKEIFQAVKESQTYAISLLKPGTNLRTYEGKVARFVGMKLKELGVIKNVTEPAVRTYFPHATSHFLGLNVHDVGDYQKPLKSGTVITVEPGIYIAEEGIGVRIEDDILITEDGAKVLSASLPVKL